MRKGPNYAPKRKKVATDLTRENLQRYDVYLIMLSWEECNFSMKSNDWIGFFLISMT